MKIEAVTTLVLWLTCIFYDGAMPPLDARCVLAKGCIQQERPELVYENTYSERVIVQVFDVHIFLVDS